MNLFKRHYIILLCLGLVFMAPGIAAYVFYQHPQWLGASKTNKGVFLRPPVLLSSLQAPANVKTAANHLPGKASTVAKWQLILWNPGTCDATCMAQIDRVARIRLALGRRLYEVEPLLMLDADAPALSATQTHTLREADIRVLKLPSSVRRQVSVLDNQATIFMANPDHYLILSYSPQARSADIFHDLKQLLTTTNQGN